MQALLGDDPSLAPLKQLLIERTAGNPFFLEETVRTLVETQVLVGAPGAYRVARDLPTIQVPATVQAVLAARIDRLPLEVKHLLQTAAVIGHEVPLAVLQAIADCSEEALHRSLTQLQGAEFLYETRLFPEREYTFKHALTHEVAYGSLLLERRRVLHARIVEALEALAGDRLAEVVSGAKGLPAGRQTRTRSNAWRTTPCGARCGTRPWRTAGRPGTRPWRSRPTVRPWGTSSRRSVPCPISQSVATRMSRPSISGSRCARRSIPLATLGASWRCCARPRPSPRPSPILTGWDRSCSFCHNISTVRARMTGLSPPPSVSWRLPRPAGMPSCMRGRTTTAPSPTRSKLTIVRPSTVSGRS